MRRMNKKLSGSIVIFSLASAEFLARAENAAHVFPPGEIWGKCFSFDAKEFIKM